MKNREAERKSERARAADRPQYVETSAPIRQSSESISGQSICLNSVGFSDYGLFGGGGGEEMTNIVFVTKTRM